MAARGTTCEGGAATGAAGRMDRAALAAWTVGRATGARFAVGAAERTSGAPVPWGAGAAFELENRKCDDHN